MTSFAHCVKLTTYYVTKTTHSVTTSTNCTEVRFASFLSGGLNIINRHTSETISVLRLSFCQKDSPKGGSFGQKDSLITYHMHAIITRGLYIFHLLFEAHLCTVTFGPMYG